MATVKKNVSKATPETTVTKVKKMISPVVVSPVWSVISLSGTQYKVRQGEVLSVDRLPVKEGNEVTVDKVNLLFDGQRLRIGTPYLDSVSVVLAVEKELRGPKIDVFKYKAKARYRKRRGHRQNLSKLRVVKINYGA